MSRRGTLRRRCSSCGATMKDGTCPKGHDAWAWSYTIDAAPPGAPRRQLTRSGFNTKRQALDSMSRLQEQLRSHTFVELSRRTVGDYLTTWLDGLAATGLRASTIANYRTIVTIWVVPSVGEVPLQSLDADHLDTLYAMLLREGRTRPGRAVRAHCPLHPHGDPQGVGRCPPEGDRDTQRRRFRLASFGECCPSAGDELLDT